MEEDPRDEGDPRPRSRSSPERLSSHSLPTGSCIGRQTDSPSYPPRTGSVSTPRSSALSPFSLSASRSCSRSVRTSSRVQTDIIRKQDEILNRTEKLTLRISRQAVDPDAYVIEALDDGVFATWATVGLDLAVVNEGRASRKSAYVVIALPVAPPGLLLQKQTRWARGIEDAVHGVPIVRRETYLDAHIFVQRHVAVNLELRVEQPEQSKRRSRAVLTTLDIVRLGLPRDYAERACVSAAPVIGVACVGRRFHGSNSLMRLIG
jgi:hypothetical protein